MERRNFSIEPYVAASGILGDRLEVDEKAADSVMRRTALRRDFNVARGYSREAREAEGDEVLAISTARVHNQHERSEAGSSEFADLIRNPDSWVLSVHDQQIGDNVNEWMDKHFKAGNGKSGREVFAQKFVEGFRQEVADGMRSAFWDEKKNVFIGSTLSSLRFVAPIGGLCWMLYESSRYITSLNNEGISSPNYQLLLISLRGGAAIFSGRLVSRLSQYLYSQLENDVIFQNPLELLVPNPQIPSIVLGSASLLLNSGKLVRLKQKE